MIEIIKIRMRLFLSRKTLAVIFVIFPLFLSLASVNFLGMNDSEINSKIGIVDEDKSFISGKLVNRLIEDETLIAVLLEEDLAMDKLLDESITGLYTIKKGFSQKIKSGETKNLIRVEYLSDNYIASGVTDIITPYFLYDVLKNITEKKTLEIIKNKEGLEGDFIELFKNNVSQYENIDELELKVIIGRVEGEFDKKPYSPSKEILIKYLISIMLIFHMIAAFYQSMAIYEDRNSRVIERIMMSRVSSIGYVFGNIIGIGLMIFIIASLQFLLLKFVFFSHLNVIIMLIDLFIYSMSISIFATAISYIFRTRADYQIAVPYLLIAIWLLGNWMYSGDILRVGIPEFLSFIPGMDIKDHIILSFLNQVNTIDGSNILKEVIIQIVYFVFIVAMTIFGRKMYERRS